MRSGTWFDPALVAAAEDLHRLNALWQDARPGDPVDRCRELVMDMQPDAGQLLPDDIDIVCEAFADVVDAKSPYTYQHSRRVAEVAVALARALHLPEDRQRLLRRCGWLHDLGKLGMPNTILDKRGALSASEWALVREHPRQTRSVLERVPAFTELAVIASEHHEQLDGTGYPRGLTTRETTLESRILVLADQFAGMTEKRPYHPGYDAESAVELIRTRVPGKVDERCFAALEFLVRAGMSADQLTSDLLVELA
jgi:putative nucleotidyltransferase with HDIG domain